MSGKKTLPKVPIDVFGEEYQFTFKLQGKGLGPVKIIERDVDGAKINLTDYRHC